jgi:hypothetical protein
MVMVVVGVRVPSARIAQAVNVLSPAWVGVTATRR